MSRIRNITTALAAVLLTAPAFAYDIQTPGNDTKLSVYGYVYALGNYFIDQQQVGVGAISAQNMSVKPDGNYLFSVQPSRYGFASTTPDATFGAISTKIEFDLNGVTTGAAFHMRHAFVKVGNLEFGHTFSTWNDLDAGPDTVDWGGPVGLACWDTPRRPLIRYTFNFDKNNSLAIAAERNTGLDGDVYSAGTPDNKIPTFIAAYTFADSWGHVGARAMAITHSDYLAPVGATAAVTTYAIDNKATSPTFGQIVATTTPAAAAVPSSRFSKTTAAFMLSGDVKIGKNDLVWSVYNGSGLGDWGTGNTGSFNQSAQIIAATQTVNAYKNTGFDVGYTQVFTPVVRANAIVSGVIYNKDTFVASADIKSSYNVLLNVFYNLNAKTQLGVEYMYETAKSFGVDGKTGVAQPWKDKNGAPTDSNNSSKIEVVLQAKF
jgi:hypothetical protein